MSFANEFYWVILLIAVYAWFTDVNRLLNVSIENWIWLFVHMISVLLLFRVWRYCYKIVVRYILLLPLFRYLFSLPVNVYLPGCSYRMGLIPYHCDVIHRVKFRLHYPALLISDTLIDVSSNIWIICSLYKRSSFTSLSSNRDRGLLPLLGCGKAV